MSRQQPRRPIRIAASHPAAAGHFPGNPLVPGVVLLDEVIAALREARSDPPSSMRIAQAKFHSPVKFGETLDLVLRPRSGGGVDFRIQRDEEVVTSGRLDWVEP